MMSMAELFYGENEPTWVLGNTSHPASAYVQQGRDYEIPAYTDRHYAANRYMQPAREYDIPAHANRHFYTASPYMQPARDYEIPAYTDRQYYTASRYMQPARDYEIPAYTDSHYIASRYMQPARDHHEIPTYTDRQYRASQYTQPEARDHEVHRAHTDRHDRVQSSARGQEPTTYMDRRLMSPHLQSAGREEVQVTYPANRLHATPNSARQGVPTTHTTENSPRQNSMSSTDPSSRTSQQLPISSVQTGAPRHKSLPTRLELRVPLCCERCEERVKESLLDMDGVEDVLCDQSKQKVTVTGDVQPQKVLKLVKKIKKRSDFWIRDSRTTTTQQSGWSTQSRSHMGLA